MSSRDNTAPDPNRRGAVRHECPQDRQHLLIVIHCHQARWARLHDVSKSGIGLCASGPFEPGAEVFLRFCGDGATSPRLRGEVRYSERRHDGTWALGCRLDAPADCLSGPAAARLQALLQQAEPAAVTPGAARPS
jgi:hypothetical protein